MTDREIERGPDGKIRKAKLSSEEASRMGKRSAEVRWFTTKTAEALLDEQGYNDKDNPAPSYVKLMAEQAVKTHQAMRDWRKFIGVIDDTDDQPAVIDCPYRDDCMTFEARENGFYYSPEEMEAARQRIAEYRKNGDEAYKKRLERRSPYPRQTRTTS